MMVVFGLVVQVDEEFHRCVSFKLAHKMSHSSSSKSKRSVSSKKRNGLRDSRCYPNLDHLQKSLRWSNQKQLEESRKISSLVAMHPTCNDDDFDYYYLRKHLRTGIYGAS